jgi:hypothetical protein
LNLAHQWARIRGFNQPIGSDADWTTKGLATMDDFVDQCESVFANPARRPDRRPLEGEALPAQDAQAAPKGDHRRMQSP